MQNYNSTWNVGFMGQIGINMGQNMRFMGIVNFMASVGTLDEVIEALLQ